MKNQFGARALYRLVWVLGFPLLVVFIHACGGSNNPTTPANNAPANPTNTFTSVPSATATNSPTNSITPTPTSSPTPSPTPTISDTPTNSPTPTISNTPTDSPTVTPTSTPTLTATLTPTLTITDTPTITSTPTDSPTVTPTSTPTNTATVTPTSTPTMTFTPVPHSLITSWGGNGPPYENGVFEQAWAVAVDKTNSWVYVLDGYAYDIQRFDLNGGFLANICTEYTTPVIGAWGGGCDPSGNLYTGNNNANNVVLFNSSGVTYATWSTWTGAGNGYFNGPQAVAVNAAGTTIAVANLGSLGNTEVDLFQSNGTFVSVIASTYANGLAFDGSGNLWLSKGTNSTLNRFAPGATTPNLTISTANSVAFSNPTGVAVDGNNNVYVSDKNNNRVVEFNSSGSYLFSISISAPLGLACDASNNLYVVASNYVYKYNP